MAEKEIVAQIEKLRKTRPARAVEAMVVSSDGTARNELIVVLSMLRNDLKDEARLVEQAKLRGGTSIVKDRLAVAGWLELFVIQLGRENDAPRSPAPARTEPVTTHEALNSFVSDMAAQGKGELVAGDAQCPASALSQEHEIHTWIGEGSKRWRCKGWPMLLSDADIDANEAYGARQPLGSTADYLSGASDTLPYVPGSPLADREPVIADDAAAYIGDALIEQVVGTDTGQAPTGIMTALGLNAAEQAVHDTIDREYAHVTAEPIIDPFAPIPRAVWAPAVPPNGRAWTALDLLEPVDAASLPPHLSFSQATTVGDCGAKYRMQKLAKVPQVPQWANVGGTAFHKAIERIEANGAPTEQVTVSLWQIELEAQIVIVEAESGMTREQFRASGQGREGYDWWRVEGHAMLQRYVSWRLGFGARDVLLSGPDGKPMLEWETTYAVDHVPFKTILDSVWINTDGAAIIRDWKTGSMTPDNRQLCTQAWGLRMAGWQGEILVQFFDARKGTFTEPFDPFGEQGMSWDDVRYFVLSADAQRRLPILPARPSDFCGGCPVAYACPIMSQRKAPKAATK